MDSVKVALEKVSKTFRYSPLPFPPAASKLCKVQDSWHTCPTPSKDFNTITSENVLPELPKHRSTIRVKVSTMLDLESSRRIRVLALLAAAVIVVTSAIYYADTRMKTEDYGFKGFPVCWNMVVFTILVTSPSERLSIVFVLVTAVLTFVPVIFVHPVRVKILRPLTLTMLGVWLGGALVALYFNMHSPSWVNVVIAASGLYLFTIGFILQMLGRLR